jgi:hypothetical protein
MLLLNGLAGLLKAAMMPDMSEMLVELGPPGDLPRSFQLVLAGFRHAGIVSISVVLVSLVVLVAGIGFLRMKLWARGVLLAFSWTAVGVAIAGGLFAMFTFAEMNAIIGPSGDNPAPLWFSFMWVGMAGLMALFVAAVPVTGIVLLTRPSVRRALG